MHRAESAQTRRASIADSREFLPQAYRGWLDFNPFTFYPEFFRALLLGLGTVEPFVIFRTLMIAVAACALGYAVFQRLDSRFEDFL